MLDKIIWAFASSSSLGSTAFTVALVPTGINTGVSISPWGVCKTPILPYVFDDFSFVSKEKFLEEIQNDNVLEYNEYVGNFYGTPKDIVFEKINNGIDVVLEIEVNGAKMIKEKVPNCVSIFIAPPSYDALKERLVGRNTEPPDVIEKRLIKAEDEISSANLYDYIVINDDVEEAANEVISIIESEHLRVDRILNDYYKFIWRR